MTQRDAAHRAPGPASGGAASEGPAPEPAAGPARYEIVGSASGDPTVRDLAALCQVAAGILSAPTAAVHLFDDRYQHRVAGFGVDPASYPRESSMCETTLAEGRDIVVADARTDDRFAASPWVRGPLGEIRFFCSVILRTPAGEPIGTLCVFDAEPRTASPAQLDAVRVLGRQAVDVLELRLRTRQLELANAELGRGQDRLLAFTGQLSHDLKAPITAILGFAELLQELDPIADDPLAAAYVARCTSAGQRMLGMVEELLAYARIGAAPKPRPVAPEELMPGVLAALGAAAADAEVTWSGPAVEADPTQLGTLLRHLVANALAYRGQRRCVVRVETRRTGPIAEVRVVDNGVGIPEERRAEVLRPLVRLHGDVPGAGLGLAVCTRIAAAHGGTLELGAADGGGTTVTVRLPQPPTLGAAS